VPVAQTKRNVKWCYYGVRKKALQNGRAHLEGKLSALAELI